jgi:hypothetical protein
MGERDAFGREKQEDSLAEMGWKPGPAATPTPVEPVAPAAPVEAAAPSAFDAGEAGKAFGRAAPVKPEPAPSALSAGEAAAPKPPPPRPPAPTFSRPRRRGPSLARLIILVAIIGAGAIGVSALARVGGNAVDGIRDKIGAITSPQPAPSASAQESLLRPAPLRAALAKLPQGKLVLLRLDADSLDAQVISGSRRHTVHMATTGPSFNATTPVGVDQPGFKVNVAAPLRAARTAARRSGLSVDDVDYLVRTPDGWTLFFKNEGPRFRATPSGRKVTKL